MLSTKSSLASASNPVTIAGACSAVSSGSMLMISTVRYFSAAAIAYPLRISDEKTCARSLRSLILSGSCFRDQQGNPTDGGSQVHPPDASLARAFRKDLRAAYRTLYSRKSMLLFTVRYSARLPDSDICCSADVFR